MQGGSQQQKGQCTIRPSIMRSLVQAIQDLSRARSVDQIAAIVRVTARQLTGADGATFVLRDGEQCYYMDEDAIGPLWKGKRFPSSACVSGWAMKHRQVAAIEDIYTDDRIPHDAYRPTFVRSLVMVPIRSADPIGAIGNYWASPHRATADEIEALQALADSTAIAMENAYLHASMQRQVEERTRELQLAREEAERASATKSRFLAAASHNLRQPIQALSTLAAILRRVDDVRQSREQLNAMSLAIGNMQSMLDTLLDLHRLDAGAVEPTPQDTSLAEMFERLRSEFSCVAGAKSLSLHVAASAPLVRTDPQLLQEILRNFISNAIKYTKIGGVTLECQSDTNGVTITVRDTGPGIPESHLKRIFEAFYRVPGSRSEQGLGLGLSIADQLARILGHPIAVESEVGAGTRFSIRLPYANATSTSPDAQATAAMGKQSRAARILYVEDDASVRHALTTLLGIEGYEVAAVTNGTEALRLLERADEPHLVISDFHLGPGETGEQVVRRVRERFGREIPALLLTGTLQQGTWPVGARGHRVLQKPIDANLLLNEIASLLNER
jgi:two-component system CheB/CheR fusion protein